VTLQELQRRGIVQCLMQTNGVMGVLPNRRLTIHLQEATVMRCDLVEFLVVGAVGTLDMPIEFGRPRREDWIKLTATGGVIDPRTRRNGLFSVEDYSADVWPEY